MFIIDIAFHKSCLPWFLPLSACVFPCLHLFCCLMVQPGAWHLHCNKTSQLVKTCSKENIQIREIRGLGGKTETTDVGHLEQEGHII